MDDVLPFNELSSMPAGVFDRINDARIPDTLNDKEELAKLKSLSDSVRFQIPPLYAKVNSLTAEIESRTSKYKNLKNAVQLLTEECIFGQETNECIRNQFEDSVKMSQALINDLEKKRDEACVALNFLSSVASSFAPTREGRAEANFCCPICFSNDVSIVFDPCGHSICSTCSEKTTSSFCHTCRVYVNKKIKLFVG